MSNEERCPDVFEENAIQEAVLHFVSRKRLKGVVNGRVCLDKFFAGCSNLHKIIADKILKYEDVYCGYHLHIDATGTFLVYDDVACGTIEFLQDGTYHIQTKRSFCLNKALIPAQANLRLKMATLFSYGAYFPEFSTDEPENLWLWLKNETPVKRFGWAPRKRTFGDYPVQMFSYSEQGLKEAMQNKTDEVLMVFFFGEFITLSEIIFSDGKWENVTPQVKSWILRQDEKADVSSETYDTLSAFDPQLMRLMEMKSRLQAIIDVHHEKLVQIYQNSSEDATSWKIYSNESAYFLQAVYAQQFTENRILDEDLNFALQIPSDLKINRAVWAEIQELYFSCKEEWYQNVFYGIVSDC